MKICPDILKANGAICKQYDKNEVVFYEQESANYYFQIDKGNVKMMNDNSEGKQFLQGVFSDGDSFGEPPLMINEFYPCTAITITPCTILRLHKNAFLEMLEKVPEFKIELLRIFARRLYNKAVTAKEIVNHNPESRILSFFDSYKKKKRLANECIIPYTRQMLADFTGLRVETVIRTLARMKDKGKINIVNRKVIY